MLTTLNLLLPYPVLNNGLVATKAVHIQDNSLVRKEAPQKHYWDTLGWILYNSYSYNFASYILADLWTFTYFFFN